MKDEIYYIYKITDKNDLVLYVGQTSNIDSRIRNHLNNKYWIKQGYKFYIYKCFNKTDVDIYEIYYINKHKAFYNKENANDINFSINLQDVEFTLYKTVTLEDLKTRNKKYQSAPDLQTSKLCLDILKNKGFDESNGFKYIGFQGCVIDGVPVSYIRATLTNNVIVELFFKDGLHKLFVVKQGEKQNIYLKNLEVFLFMVWKVSDGNSYGKTYSIWLDDCEAISQFDLIHKESDIY